MSSVGYAQSREFDHSHRNCITPGEPSKRLSLGVESRIDLDSRHSEYWFCIQSPFSGIDISVFAPDRSKHGEIRLSLDLFSQNMESVFGHDEAVGWGGDRLFHSKRFGMTNKDHEWAIAPGLYYLRIGNDKLSKGLLQVFFRQALGDSAQNWFQNR